MSKVYGVVCKEVGVAGAREVGSGDGAWCGRRVRGRVKIDGVLGSVTANRWGCHGIVMGGVSVGVLDPS